MKKQESWQWRRAWAALPLFLGVLVLVGALRVAPESFTMAGPAMAGLIGGSGGPWCAFGTGLAAGLGMTGSLLTLGGITSPVGAGLSLAAGVVGIVTYLGC
ncbi:MAG: hypothetical protein SF339_13505 [Blastocatellia bacterium]|nr:hypothetical protein [Blastocatellia bacterium]